MSTVSNKGLKCVDLRNLIVILIFEVGDRLSITVDYEGLTLVYAKKDTESAFLRVTNICYPGFSCDTDNILGNPLGGHVVYLDRVFFEDTFF